MSEKFLFRSVSFVQSNILDKNDVTLAGIPVSSNATSIFPKPTDPPFIECVIPSVPVLLGLNEGFFMDGIRAVSWSELAGGINLPGYFERRWEIQITSTENKMSTEANCLISFITYTSYASLSLCFQYL